MDTKLYKKSKNFLKNYGFLKYIKNFHIIIDIIDYGGYLNILLKNGLTIQLEFQKFKEIFQYTKYIHKHVLSINKNNNNNDNYTIYLYKSENGDIYESYLKNDKQHRPYQLGPA